MELSICLPALVKWSGSEHNCLSLSHHRRHTIVIAIDIAIAVAVAVAESVESCWTAVFLSKRSRL